jgi:hypothetical protein
VNNHIKQSRSNWFCGPVIDGPYAGDWIDHNSPFFQTYALERYVIPQTYGLHTAAIEIDQVFYKWLSGYGAWAHIPPWKRTA